MDIKIFNKVSTAILAVVFMVGLFGTKHASAATTPSLGVSAIYGVLSDSYNNASAGTIINGDIGFDTAGPAVVPGGAHTNYGSGFPYAVAGADQNNAIAELASQPCTFNFGSGEVNLSTDTLHGPAGIYAPGVYCSSGSMTVGSQITLSGSGTYIFRPVGSLSSVPGAVVTLAGGADVCDVFWMGTLGTVLRDNTSFAGTIIDVAGITVGAGTVLTGRALAYGGTVTTNSATITLPTCGVAPSPILSPSSSSLSRNNTLTVFKQVINDNGGKAAYSDFPLFVNGNPVASGQNIVFAPGIYTVTETSLPNYKTTFAGDCSAGGVVNHGGINTHNDICTVVNDDIGPAAAPIPPLIHVTAIPSSFTLPGGVGTVTYNYAVSNVGIAPITNVILTDDKCGSIGYVSGDKNLDSKLDVGEIWSYSCVMTLAETGTHTVTAKGSANGLSATDIAEAAVVVGSTTQPPLIDLVKIPLPLFLPSVGGLVKYAYLVNNPGVVPLSGVTLVDDKCALMFGYTGDGNGNNLLDTHETWTYFCQENLSATTANTGTARGSANGLTSSHSSVVTVVVSGSKPASALAPAFVRQVLAITANLTLGSRGNDVKLLQQFLIAQELGPAAQALAKVGVTSYFGTLTRAALAEFQAKTGIKPPLGYFGPITRAYLKANY